jgi:hypothetical protein
MPKRKIAAIEPVAIEPIAEPVTEPVQITNLPALIPAEPVAEPEPVATGSDRADAKAAAALAVAAYYPGASLPFKAASELRHKAPLNFANRKAPSRRSAALIATILAYCDIEPGTLRFVRGSGRVPGSLLGYTGEAAKRLFACGPESGGFGNMLGCQAEYISGPLGGNGAETAVLALNYKAALANLRDFNEKQSDGEHLFSAAIALLDMLANPTS